MFWNNLEVAAVEEMVEQYLPIILHDSVLASAVVPSTVSGVTSKNNVRYHWKRAILPTKVVRSGERD